MLGTISSLISTDTLTAPDPVGARKILKSKRTDLAIGQRLAPDAIIEVKIRINRYSGLASDLRKLRDTITFMKPARQRTIIGASVFQMHLKATSSRWRAVHFAAAVRAFEARLTAEVLRHGVQFRNFSLTLHDLMSSTTDGIVDQAIEEDGDGTPMLADKGHATRYYAIIMKHRLYGTPSPSTLAATKAENGL